MGFGKIKEAWPVWTLLIAGIAVIVLAFTQNKPEKDLVTLQDIFPEEAVKSSAVTMPPQAADSAVAPGDPVKSPAIVANSDFNQKQLSYAVQLYSFKDQSRADSMVKKLKDDGLPAYAQISDLGPKGTWYRVRVGSYDTPEEAKATLAMLLKEHKEGIIVKDNR